MPQKIIYLPDDRETRTLLHEIDDWCRANKSSFSSAARQALRLLADKDRKVVQMKLSEYQLGGEFQLASQLESLHRRFVSPNPERHGTWRDALEANKLNVEPAIVYSRSRGWIR